MMDVSGTDPRTRTSFFLWPWANYPAVAANAHNQPIMGAAGAGAMGSITGSNMLGVPHSTSGSNMMDDPFGTFCQRFSYPGAAAAAHMSHIIPNQHDGSNNLTGTANNNNTRANDNAVNENVSSQTNNNLGLTSTSNGNHSSHSPHSSRSFNRSTNSNNNAHHGVSANVCEDHSVNNFHSPNNRHAVAFAAFASGIMGNSVGQNDSAVCMASTNGLPFSHHMQQSLKNCSANDMVLDNLCTCSNKSGSFGLAKHQQSGNNASSKLQNNMIHSHSLHCQHLKKLNNTAAVALAAVAVANDHNAFHLHDMSDENNGNANGDKSMSGTGRHNEENYARRQSGYMFSSKSPLSDSVDNLSTNESGNVDLTTKTNNHLTNGAVNCNRKSTSSMENVRSSSTNTITTNNNRHMSGTRDRSNSLIFRPGSIQDGSCSSPVSTTPEQPCSSDMLVDDSNISSRDDINASNHLRAIAHNGLNMDARFLRISQDESISLAGLCNGDASLSSLVSMSNGHHNGYHQPTKGYKCKICQHVCFSRHDLSTHNASTHKQDPRPYRCEQCGRQFSTCAYLSQHRRIHTGVKPYACRYCDRRFTQLSHVQQHERIHTGEKPYRCSTCMKSFTQMSNLQSHQRQHMKGKPFRCEQCFMSFDTKDELDVHVQARHSGNRYAKVLVCPICTKSYNSETYLAKHVERHKEAAATTNLSADIISHNNFLPTSINGMMRTSSSQAVEACAAAVAAAKLRMNAAAVNNTKAGMGIPNMNSVSGMIGTSNMSQSCTDNLFVAANFHNHPVAMAAAALSRGSVIDPNGHVRHSSHNLHSGHGGISMNGSNIGAANNSQHEAATATAAAVAQVHHDLQRIAVAAAANGAQRAELEQSCAFFNSNNCTFGSSSNLCEPRVS